MRRVVGVAGRGVPMSDDGIPWLTDPQQAFLAHLTVITLLPQMQEWKPDDGYTYDRLLDAMGDLAAAGEVDLRADQQDVYVLIRGQVIVHAARDWLEWMTPRWATAGQN
jgi:hypothetical protein